MCIVRLYGQILLYTVFFINELCQHVENTKNGHKVKTKENKNKTSISLMGKGTWYQYLLHRVRLVRLSLMVADSPDHRL